MRALFLVTLCGCQSAMTPSVAVPTDDPSAEYGALLSRVVTDDGYVRWDELTADRAALDEYVAWLSRPGALDGDLDKVHATWLNAYNAWTMYGVLQADVPASVKDVPGWIPQPGSGFFLENTYNIGGQQVSLYAAEHQHIRGNIGDWRDHAALNCASGSCPALRQELYDAALLDAQLNDQVRRWANDPVRGWRATGDTLEFNPIFDWFAADFPAQDGGLCSLLAPYADPARQQILREAQSRGCPTSHFEYDWRLNHPPGQ